MLLDKDLCQGHAVCVGEAPEVFYIGEDGKVALHDLALTAAHHSKVRAAQKFCPTRAIRLREE